MRMEQLEADKEYIRLMLNFANETQKTLQKVKKFGIDLHDEMVISSLAMHLGQIGEQLDSRKLSEEVKAKYEYLIPWSEMKRFRDFAYHHYGNTDSRIIVNTVFKDVPSLIEGLEQVYNDLQRELGDR